MTGSVPLYFCTVGRMTPGTRDLFRSPKWVVPLMGHHGSGYTNQTSAQCSGTAYSSGSSQASEAEA